MERTPFDSHIASQFDEELEKIFSQLMAMGGRVEQQLQNAVKSLFEGDSLLAEAVIDGDEDVDKMEMRIDEACVLIIARRQPTASDLRLVIAVTRAVSDLERIGDESGKVARHSVGLSEQGPSAAHYSLMRPLAVAVTRMLHDALDGFARFDAEMALTTLQCDEQVDQEYTVALEALDKLMVEDSANVRQYVDMLWVVRSLERIGDHAKNLCEQIVFVTQGRDIRHRYHTS